MEYKSEFCSLKTQKYYGGKSDRKSLKYFGIFFHKKKMHNYEKILFQVKIISIQICKN